MCLGLQNARESVILLIASLFRCPAFNHFNHLDELLFRSNYSVFSSDAFLLPHFQGP